MSHTGNGNGNGHGSAVATMHSAAGLERREAGAIRPETIEIVIATGDLAQLSSAQRVEYYMARCEASGLDWTQRPFEYVVLDRKLTLYPNKNCADQLRGLREVSVVGIEREMLPGAGDLYAVTVTVRDKAGRLDQDMGVVSLAGLGGTVRANAIMKAITKGKRRATFSLCGISGPDETELETIPGARRVTANVATGEVIDAEEIETGEIDPELAADAAASPGATSRGASAPTNDPNAISDAQRKKLWASWREKVPEDADGALLHAVARETYGIDASLWELSKADASGLIDWIVTNPAAALRQYAADVARKQAIARGQQALPGTAETQGHLELSPQEQTWLGNIERAVSIERLDQIAENLTNLGLLGQPALAEALEARRREIAAERAAQFRG